MDWGSLSVIPTGLEQQMWTVIAKMSGEGRLLVVYLEVLRLRPRQRSYGPLFPLGANRELPVSGVSQDTN